ncbi:hypothetical protein FDP41_000179 [Naegleria fowleri]|uniref:Uncharacterized protein n=1 Tax=Naegleria fowleri TaxID=5763 RepID=A0A6A5CI18_NAEFO|nr:uncharacterized protein FDP41_000179 [Naegleria fowleri]KAF0985140.1 hypothetical protein FDP41_000179 [Naegleria fowleri]
MFGKKQQPFTTRTFTDNDHQVFDLSKEFDAKPFPFIPASIHPFESNIELEAVKMMDPFELSSYKGYRNSESQVKSMLQSTSHRRHVEKVLVEGVDYISQELQHRFAKYGAMINYQMNAQVLSGVVTVDHELGVWDVQCVPSQDSSSQLSQVIIDFADGSFSARKWVPGTRLVIDSGWNCMNNDVMDTTMTTTTNQDTLVFLVLTREILKQSSNMLRVKFEVKRLPINEVFLNANIKMKSKPLSVPSSSVPAPFQQGRSSLKRAVNFQYTKDMSLWSFNLKPGTQIVDNPSIDIYNNTEGEKNLKSGIVLKVSAPQCNIGLYINGANQPAPSFLDKSSIYDYRSNMNGNGQSLPISFIKSKGYGSIVLAYTDSLCSNADVYYEELKNTDITVQFVDNSFQASQAISSLLNISSIQVKINSPYHSWDKGFIQKLRDDPNGVTFEYCLKSNTSFTNVPTLKSLLNVTSIVIVDPQTLVFVFSVKAEATPSNVRLIGGLSFSAYPFMFDSGYDIKARNSLKFTDSKVVINDIEKVFQRIGYSLSFHLHNKKNYNDQGNNNDSCFHTAVSFYYYLSRHDPVASSLITTIRNFTSKASSSSSSHSNLWINNNDITSLFCVAFYP